MAPILLLAGQRSERSQPVDAVMRYPSKKSANDDQLEALLQEYKQLGARSKQRRKQPTRPRGREPQHDSNPVPRKPEQRRG